MATAFITFLAVVYGYLSRSLPGEYYNELDSCLLTLFEKFLQWLPHLLRLRMPKWNRKHNREHQEIEPTPKPPDEDLIKKAKEERDDMKVESLQKFILVLSDQQLVTGFAILVAGILKSCTISWWEFQIVVSLAWFSSTTHLSTLVILWEYLQDHPEVRNWRVGGMLAVFDLTVPIVLVFLFFAYSNQLVKLFSEDRQNTIFKVLERTITSACIKGITGVSRQEWRDKYSKVIEDQAKNRLEIERRKWKTRMEKRTLRQQKRHKDIVIVFSAIRLVSTASNLYLESFVWQIVWLIFGLGYGIAQLVNVRWQYTPSLAPGVGGMDFGQIVPLLLLVLPGLAAGEAYYGKFLAVWGLWESKRS
jgi:hypothetical protein